jgi:uncharacterized membrane protein (TIGR02234 family)
MGTVAEKQKRLGHGSSMRGKVGAALMSALGAGLILMSVGQDWAHGTVSEPIRMSIDATGTQLSGLPDALGLVGLAGAVALFAVRRIGRYAVGVLLLGAGVGVIAVVAGQFGHLDAPLVANAAAQSIAGSTAQVSGVGTTGWPYLALFGGLLVALAGADTLVFGRNWTGLSSRYDAPSAPGARDAGSPGTAAESAEPTARELWDALGRGADPTG